MVMEERMKGEPEQEAPKKPKAPRKPKVVKETVRLSFRCDL